MQKRVINKLIVHVTDSPDTRNVSMLDISKWHQEMNCPKSSSGLYCGYHYVIKRDGTVEVARPDFEMGAHTKGQNKNSLGICWVGRNEMANVQMTALIQLCANLCVRYGLEAKQVFGHREFNNAKSCPNIASLDGLRDSIELKIAEMGGLVGTGSNR